MKRLDGNRNIEAIESGARNDTFDRELPEFADRGPSWRNSRSSGPERRSFADHEYDVGRFEASRQFYSSEIPGRPARGEHSHQRGEVQTGVGEINDNTHANLEKKIERTTSQSDQSNPAKVREQRTDSVRDGGPDAQKDKNKAGYQEPAPRPPLKENVSVSDESRPRTSDNAAK